jgi:hypothetical protein
MIIIKNSDKNAFCDSYAFFFARPSRQPLLIYITQQDDRDRVAETLIARPWPEPGILVVDGIPKGRLFGDLSLKMTLKMSPKICLNNPLLDSIFQSLYL